MKKKSFLIGFLLIMLFSLVACNSSSESKEDGPEKINGAFATGSSGGIFDILGGGLASVINQNSESVKLNTTIPSSISVVPQLLDSGNAVIGFGVADMVKRAKEGTGEFDEKYDNVKVALALFDNAISMVARADAPFSNITELKGKKIGVSSTSIQEVVKNYLELAGIQEDEVNFVFLSYSEQADALKDGNIDVGNFTSYPKIGLLEDLSTSKAGLKIIKIDPELVKEWDEKYPLWLSSLTPAGTYKGADEDTYYFSYLTILYVNGDLSDDVVYSMTEAILENPDDVSAIHPIGKSIVPEKTKEYIDRDIIEVSDIHPGALKYFKEKGIIED